MSALSDIQIDGILRNNEVTKKHFLGVFPEDGMPNYEKSISFVTNTDSHVGPGKHWNAWWISDDGVIDFWDSFGRSPLSVFLPVTYHEYVKNRRYHFNSKIVEGLFSKTCGHDCIYMIYCKSLGIDLKFISNSFSNNLSRNDDFVVNFVYNIM